MRFAIIILGVVTLALTVIAHPSLAQDTDAVDWESLVVQNDTGHEDNVENIIQFDTEEEDFRPEACWSNHHPYYISSHLTGGDGPALMDVDQSEFKQYNIAKADWEKQQRDTSLLVTLIEYERI
ncbi:hypothetical protein EC973_001654 [Apophysomyces ossiformis]|uniref:Uncharacterized protein n=1 Tax=Apophysomyces ossiformis TaxID=679940 RepID=A0A8H7EV52_9FUNG|nr:hypothetical protein EC973_001654 [Apophysomyces ossiformis]